MEQAEEIGSKEEVGGKEDIGASMEGNKDRRLVLVGAAGMQEDEEEEEEDDEYAFEEDAEDMQGQQGEWRSLGITLVKILRLG